MYLFVLCVCCVLDSPCELFGETIHDVFGCGCLPQNVCVVHLSVPSICFVCVFVCRKSSPHLRV